MSATAPPVWAGIVVRDVAASARWYADAFGVTVTDCAPRYAVTRFADGSTIELLAGDPTRPSSAFPSYRDEAGPRVMPGFRVTDPAETGRAMVVARWLPEWIVVVGPGGLRTVLCAGAGDARRGLVGFDVTGPDPEALTAWFAGFGAVVTVRPHDRLEVVPVVAGHADAELTDPDGTALRVRGAHAATG